MAIWEERYTNSKGVTETAMNHKRFLIYRDMPKRSLEKVTHQIFFKDKEFSKALKQTQEFRKKYNVIGRASSDYDWQDRVIAYDNHIAETIKNKNANTLINFFGEELDDAINLPKIIKIQLNDIIKQETEEIIVDGQKIQRKIRPSDKISMIQKLINSYDTSVKSVGYIGNCGVSKTQSRNESTVEVKESKSLFKDKEAYHKKELDHLKDLLE